MATEKQTAANRQNAKKSTGPRTQEGKLRSRRNAFRHGLTAQTVISIAENADEYTELETLILADYEPQTTVERLLVERLASLLWRLRRAAAIETGLFRTQGQVVQDRQVQSQRAPNDPLSVFRNLLSQNKSEQSIRKLVEPNIEVAIRGDQSLSTARAPELSQRFVRLAQLDCGVLERIERYEVSLWRQAAQTMAILSSLQSGLKFYGRASFRKYPAAWK